MRILITVPWGERLGGAEAMLQSILAGASESGHEVEPVFLQDGSWPEQLRKEGFRVEVLDAGRLRALHRLLSSVLRLAAILRRRRPDVILNWSAKTQLYGAPAAVLARMAARNVWWQQAIPTRDWIDVLATLLPARAIACYSQAAARAQERLRPRRRMLVIGAGSPVPAAATVPASLELPRDVPIVGLVGRLQPWKGQDRLLEAQALLRARGCDFHLLIVGGDSYGLSPHYARQLSEIVTRLGLEDRVTMTGEVPDAGPYMQAMDVLVNASDPEPFGIVLLEGMARGVAVVAVNSGGPSEFVEDGRTGVLARSGEPSALADALELLLSDSERRHGLAEAARARYFEQFTDAAMRERFFSAMASVAARRSAPTPS